MTRSASILIICQRILISPSIRRSGFARCNRETHRQQRIARINWPNSYSVSCNLEMCPIHPLSYDTEWPLLSVVSDLQLSIGSSKKLTWEHLHRAVLSLQSRLSIVYRPCYLADLRCSANKTTIGKQSRLWLSSQGFFSVSFIIS